METLSAGAKGLRKLPKAVARMPAVCPTARKVTGRSAPEGCLIRDRAAVRYEPVLSATPVHSSGQQCSPKSLGCKALMKPAYITCLVVGVVLSNPRLFSQGVEGLIHDVSYMGNGSVEQARLEAGRQIASGKLGYRSYKKGDYRTFSGTYIPPELPDDKKGRFVYGLAVFSDDGCNVSVGGTLIHDRIGKPQHLPKIADSFHEPQVALAPGEPVDITVEYSNIIYDDNPRSPGYPDIDGCSLFLYLLPAGMAVDANRDGTIAFSGDNRDTTTSETPFRFWINDDNDGTRDSEEEVINPSFPDYEDGLIQTARDLEDFARIHLVFDAFQKDLADGTVRIGLKFKNVGGTTPKIQIYRSADVGGTDSYVKDEQAALAQMGAREAATLGEVSDGPPMLLPQDFWAEENPNSTKCLLFEATGEGKGQLVMIINQSDGSQIGEGPSVWLDLKNVKKMYQRGRAVPVFQDQPYDHMDAWTPSQIIAEPFEADHPFSQPRDEEKNVIVYVHGINGPGSQDIEYQGWMSDSETIFKRLWHQGFKGRFAAFKWLALTPAFPFRFNESEYRAWKCGQGLAHFLSGLPSDYQRNLYSFSQGAPVCGAALSVYGASVANYVMTQAAVPAGCYDTSPVINNYDLFAKREPQSPTPDTTEDLGYRGYLSSLNVSGAVVSFFNTVDYALKTGEELGQNISWEANELDYKPNANLGLLGHRTYAYDFGPRSNPYPVGQRCFLRDVYAPFNQRQLTDIHESMSFVARPRSEAAGVSASVAGRITGRYNVGPGSPSAFDRDSSDHGGQFSRRIQRLQPYYENLLAIFRVQ